MGARRAAFAVALSLAGLVACEALTTPEKGSEEVIIDVALSTTVDTVTTGDSLAYSVRITRNDSLVEPKSQTWASSDGTILGVLDARQGKFLALRTGSVEVTVTVVVETIAGDVSLLGRTRVEVIRERFFGDFSSTVVRFRDRLVVTPPEEQPFSSNTQVLFPPDPKATTLSAISGLVIQRDGGIVVVVPAGFVSGRPTFTALEPDGRSMVSKTALTRAPGDTDLDPLEPNDIEPASLAIPFEDFLSIHTPQDQDAYVFSLGAPGVLSLELIWNVVSNLNASVFQLDAAGAPRLILEASDPGTASETLAAGLEPGRYIARIFAQEFAGPTTYRMAATTSPAPTLSVALSASPSTGSAPLNTSLTATVSGAATGLVNYSFWFNCPDPGIRVALVVPACGDPADPTVGARFDAQSATSMTLSHTYPSAGTFTPKVIVERGTAVPAEARTQVVVTGPPPSIILSPSTVSFTAVQGGADPAPATVNVTNGGGGTLSGLAVGPIGYGAGQPTGWLNASLANTTAPTTLTLRATTANLAPGTYNATVPVTSGVALNSPQNVSVSLNVSPATLMVALTASPSTGTAPLNVTLTATVSGTATGLISYKFWWNCNDPGTDVTAVIAACGDPANASVGAQFPGVAETTQSVSHTYQSPATFYAKVIALRGGLAAEARTLIAVAAGTSKSP
ncbi:MAG: hypothetical protein HY702_02050 [Gemmatimonadetes bacterium]|nr:hypothetical protein [Gemmatimonadota bacterium]